MFREINDTNMVRLWLDKHVAITHMPNNKADFNNCKKR